MAVCVVGSTWFGRNVLLCESIDSVTFLTLST